MRKIEENMLHAIAEMKNFKSGDTRVSIESKNVNDNVALVWLNDNLIAQWNPRYNSLFIYDGGWESNTTKSRLNAIMEYFAHGWAIVQRRHVWYMDELIQDKECLREWKGKAHFVNGTLQSS